MKYRAKRKKTVPERVRILAALFALLAPAASCDAREAKPPAITISSAIATARAFFWTPSTEIRRVPIVELVLVETTDDGKVVSRQLTYREVERIVPVKNKKKE